MSSRTLLERIEDPEPADMRHLVEDEAQLFDSIRRQLQRMLNSRRGTASATPKYGTTDFSGLLRAASSLDTIRDEMLESIALYEPRLREVEVSFSPGEDTFAMVFDVSARVITAEGELPTVFRSVVGANGQVKVSRVPTKNVEQG
ncbi:MAG: type VI secretion system baseplate subunit TssE [Deltaproteobacteria bacterium]|nr:type VI secretion system baseplate subunit TssE [Deltaproteobacteria bacterium]